ncbi:MAG: topoisomerase DNA-binding C4 zinc finger domain-containing protein [Promethearchaeota archaeon]
MTDEKIPTMCPKCNKMLIGRIGKYGKFLSCSGYPDCKYLYDLSGFTNFACPDCGKRLRVVYRKNRSFLGCSGYPDCKYIYDFKKNEFFCPKCKNPMIIRSGKLIKFLGCKNYPECNVTFNFKSSKLAFALKLKKLKNLNEDKIHYALRKLNVLKKKLELSDNIALDAIKIYETILEKKLISGRNINKFLAVSLLCASKINGKLLMFEEVANIIQIPKKSLVKNFKLISTEVLPDLNLKPKTISLKTYINDFVTILDLPNECKDLSLEIINQAKRQGFNAAGMDPKGIAGAALYMSSKMIKKNRTQKEIANIAKISVGTLRSRIKDLKRIEI